MSYILEALRRAEIERERKRRVPGLHTQPVPVPTDERTATRSKVWLWVALGVAAGILLPVLWSGWGDEAEAEVAATRGTTAVGNVTPGAVATVESPRPAPAATPTATEPPPAPAPTPAPAAAPLEPRRTSPPAARAAAKPPTSTAASAAMPATAKPGSAETSNARPPAAPTPAAPAPEARLRSLAELPEDLRRNVQPLSFGGSVYSEIAAQRMVILNGQVLREGESLGDDLVLEQIRPRSAVLRVRGQRFEVPF